MAVGILLSTVDFETWAQAYISGTTKRSLTHIQAGGTDLRDLFLSSRYGRSVADTIGNTHRQTGGTDISALFCKSGNHVQAAAIRNQIAINDYPGIATSGIRFNTDGSIDANNNNNYNTQAARWGGSSAQGAYYEVRFVYVSGDTATLNGADGVWRTLSSAREVYITATGGATTPPFGNSATIRAEWRKVGETGAAYTYTDEFTITAFFG